MASRTEAGRVRTDPRISRRRKLVERTKKRRLIWGSGSAGFAVLAVWATFWSPLLDVRNVQVSGSPHTGATAVRKAADLGSDDNLLLLSTTEVARAVETLPWVRTAEVDRRLPGTVSIKVVERRAALALTVAAGTWTLDRAGNVLEEGRAEKGLTTVSGSAVNGVRIGERVDAAEVIAALQVWRSLPRKVRDMVASVLAPSPTRIALVTGSGTVVRYGSSDRLVSKNSVLVALLARLQRDRRSASYIDVSVPTNPAVGPAATPVPTGTPAPSY